MLGWFDLLSAKHLQRQREYKQEQLQQAADWKRRIAEMEFNQRVQSHQERLNFQKQQAEQQKAMREASLAERMRHNREIEKRSTEPQPLNAYQKFRIMESGYDPATLQPRELTPEEVLRQQSDIRRQTPYLEPVFKDGTAILEGYKSRSGVTGSGEPGGSSGPKTSMVSAARTLTNIEVNRQNALRNVEHFYANKIHKMQVDGTLLPEDRAMLQQALAREQALINETYGKQAEAVKAAFARVYGKPSEMLTLPQRTPVMAPASIDEEGLGITLPPPEPQNTPPATSVLLDENGNEIEIPGSEEPWDTSKPDTPRVDVDLTPHIKKAIIAAPTLKAKEQVLLQAVMDLEKNKGRITWEAYEKAKKYLTKLAADIEEGMKSGR